MKKGIKIENKVKILGFTKWLSILLGLVMYAFTFNSFGFEMSLLMGLAFGLVFYNIVSKEQIRTIGESLANEIKMAIKQEANIKSIIELKKIRGGIIARVYLVNAKEKSILINRAINKRMEASALKKYLWIMQLTDIPGESFLGETRKMLNEQLVEEIREIAHRKKK